ncbi:MAG: hypothetical protein HZA28_06080 [Candidatus Omnitrophica bacterium]|nr:hypothetical protein [Candidatus Omnitrophota bacterium]
MIGDQSFSGFTQYLSNYFEIFLGISAAFVVFGILIQVLLKIREINFQNIFQRVLRRILVLTVVAGQALLLAIAAYLFWINYKQPAPALEFPGDVLADTSWVRDDLRIYFIDGNSLKAVSVNGQNRHEVLSLTDPVKEYHFSPDGKFLLVASVKEIYLVELNPLQKQLIDSWAPGEVSQEWNGAVSGIRWAPDSRHFCYEIARWSSFSSQNHLYVYDVANKKRQAVESPARRISSLYWDHAGENLYYLQKAAKDTSVHAYSFDVNVFRISLSSLHPEFVTRIPYNQSGIPMANLRVRGINLFMDADALSFVQGVDRDVFVSEKGQHLGIDEDDHLFYVSKKWFRHRLFRIPREPQVEDIPRHAYRGGELIITQIRWIPGGRYAIMLHRYFGILVVEPATSRTGLLIAARGNTFGWYERLDLRPKNFVIQLHNVNEENSAASSGK